MADGMSHAQYEAAENVIEADYKAAKKTCDAMSGHAEASAERSSADYSVAKERCDALSGDTKDRCIDDAKARFAQQ